MKNFVLGILFLLPHSSFGHAQIQTADPEKDAVLHATPKRVVLTFSEQLELSMSKLEVTNHKTHDVVSTGSVSNNDHKKNTLETALKDLPAKNAAYDVSWKAVGTDSHLMKGSYSFTVTAEGK
jgi:methionine-rich copper-binding protein CopC